MNKFIISIFAVLLLGLAFVSAQSALEIDSVVVNPTSGVPSDVLDITVTVRNTGANDIALVQITSTDLDLGGTIITAPTFGTITNLKATGDPDDNDVKSVTASLTLPVTLKGDYVSISPGIIVKDTSNPVNTATRVYGVTVNPINQFEVQTYTTTNPLTISGQEDDTITGTFTIKNTGSTKLNAAGFPLVYDLSEVDLTDGDKEITLSFSDPGVISPGESPIITVTADIPNNIDVDTYGGKLKITGTSGTGTPINVEFNIDIRIQPELCKDGPLGDLDITIDEPDNGDDFAPGDTIRIEVNVDNSGTKDLDVIVEAFLYNMDQDEEIERVESDPDEVQEDDDLDFDLELEIPFDSDIDENDEYVLFVKAYENGDEDKHCAEDQININIEREKHDVRIQSISVLPASAKPGEFVDIAVKAINVGSSNEDEVTVRVFEPELGWDKTSTPVDLDDGESSDNDATFRFSLEVPDTADAKAYSIEATVTFDDGDEKNSEFETFTVLEGAVTPPVIPPTDVLRIQSVSKTGENTFSVSTVVTNGGTEARTFEVELLASWASSVTPQTFTLVSGESRNVQFAVNAEEGLESGRYTGTVSVREGGALIDSETFNVEVAGESPQSGTGFSVGNLLGGNSGTVIWVLVDIVLVIVAIFFIKLIFTSGKKKKMQAKPMPQKVKL
ncbi:MAG: putative S-layer protein [Candidatus Woesearchaeota archaeon]